MTNKKTFFVTGISTEVGKTVASSILVEALKADYWKPIQSGDLHYTDSDKIKDLISNTKSYIHPEQFKLNTPASPHYAAAVDKVDIHLPDFSIPTTSNHLIIEGAGGLYVPINDKECILDLIRELNVPVILVANYYLGSINHTLSSVKTLAQFNIPIHSLIFMGRPNESSRSIIQKMTAGDVQQYIDIPQIESIGSERISEIAQQISSIISL